MVASFPGPIHMRGEPGNEATWRMKANSISCFVLSEKRKKEFIILNSLYAFFKNGKRNALFRIPLLFPSGHLPGRGFESLPESLSVSFPSLFLSLFLSFSLTLTSVKVGLSGLESVMHLALGARRISLPPPPPTFGTEPARNAGGYRAISTRNYFDAAYISI